MSFAKERAVLESYFHDNWTETEVAYDNVDFDPSTDAWVRFKIQNGDSVQADINHSNPLYRHIGVVMVQVFVPVKSGTNRARELADTVSNMFRRVQPGHGITLRTPSIFTVGPNNEWFQVNVSCPFWRNEFENE